MRVAHLGHVVVVVLLVCVDVGGVAEVDFVVVVCCVRVRVVIVGVSGGLLLVVDPVVLAVGFNVVGLTVGQLSCSFRNLGFLTDSLCWPKHKK